MFRLDEYGGLIFEAADLKEIYEPIITTYGFEYEAYLDKDNKGLIWTKLYEGGKHHEYLWPTMVIRETFMDPIPNPEEAAFFSTSLWWEDDTWLNPGFMIGVNPEEYDDDSGDEIEDLIVYMKSAQKEVNEVLEKCRQQLCARLTEIKDKLLLEAEEVLA